MCAPSLATEDMSDCPQVLESELGDSETIYRASVALGNLVSSRLSYKFMFHVDFSS